MKYSLLIRDTRMKLTSYKNSLKLRHQRNETTSVPDI